MDISRPDLKPKRTRRNLLLTAFVLCVVAGAGTFVSRLKPALPTVDAKVVQPDQLKASLKIAETQAREIQIGQPVEIDTHNGVITGHVTRIDLAVQNGTVTVDAGPARHAHRGPLHAEWPGGRQPQLRRPLAHPQPGDRLHLPELQPDRRPLRLRER